MAAELLDKGYGGYCDGAVKESLYFEFKIEGLFRVETHVTAVVQICRLIKGGRGSLGHGQSK
jgi:hypothetical protein